MDTVCDYILRKHYVDIPACFSPKPTWEQRRTRYVPNPEKPEWFETSMSADGVYYGDDYESLYWEPILKWFKSVYPIEYLQQRTLQRLLGVK